VNGPEVAVAWLPDPLGVTGCGPELKTGVPVHVALLNSVNVTVPVGVAATPGRGERVAVSVIACPNGAVGVAVVASVTPAWA
jgi:hypothetical protein